MVAAAQVRGSHVKNRERGPGAWVGGFSSTEVRALRSPSQLTLCSVVSFLRILELS